MCVYGPITWKATNALNVYLEQKEFMFIYLIFYVQNDAVLNIYKVIVYCITSPEIYFLNSLKILNEKLQISFCSGCGPGYFVHFFYLPNIYSENKCLRLFIQI